ncbi:MAG: hypothetical protein L0Y66_23515 [Myxococcaceae bacterium]|nr:hypothetical protein [Myxococcaceae bacterium]MCI0671182.1 hypothetical protein [Myxococcaceae bacterium]
MRRVSRLWVAAVLASGSAFASSAFPGTIKTKTGASVAPPCVVCHTTDIGGIGTVDKEFGLALMDAGLSAGNTTKLEQLIGDFRTQNVDTDGDGTIDFDELNLGRNPSLGGPSDCFPGSSACAADNEVPPINYGCSAGAGGSALAGLVLAGSALVSALRRRRS